MGLILDETVQAPSILDAPDKAEYVLELLKPILSKVLVAVILLLIGFIIGKIIGKTTQWFLRKVKLNKKLRKSTGIQWRVEQFISSIVSGTIYFLAIIMALTVLGLAPVIVTILSVGIILIIFAMILLSIKDFVPNYVDGFRVRQRLSEGDKIMIENIAGTVQEITWTDMSVVTKNGDILYIPNSLFLQKGFKKVR